MAILKEDYKTWEEQLEAKKLYVLLWGENPDDLMEIVEMFLANGYMPQGGVFANESYFYQAVVLTELVVDDMLGDKNDHVEENQGNT